MRRPTLTAAATLLVALLAANAALSEPASYRIDKNHSSVSFKIRRLFSKVPGRFNDFSGTIQYDDKSLANSAVDVTIQTASIFTNQDFRDKDLRSPNFFDAEKFPTLTFKSTKIVPGKDNQFQIVGDLTMHGVTKPVTLDAEFLGGGAVGMGTDRQSTQAGFDATVTIDRKEWGINWNQALDNGGALLDDKVLIELTIEAIKEQPKESAAATDPPKPPPPSSVKK